MKAIYLTILLLLVTACAAPRTALYHPTSHDIKWCKARGTGILGAPYAQKIHDECVGALKDLGYIEGSDLTPKQREGIRL